MMEDKDMKNLEIVEESYMAGRGCDCCDADELIIYDVSVDGEKIKLPWTPASELSALISFLELLGYVTTIKYRDVEDE